MLTGIHHTPPQTKYLIPYRWQRDDVFLCRHRVEESVKSSLGAVELERCIVSGQVSANKRVELWQSRCAEVCSYDGSVFIDAGSEVQEDVKAYRAIDVRDSAVNGWLLSTAAGICARRGAEIGGSVLAEREIEIWGSCVRGDIHSKAGRIELIASSVRGDLCSAGGSIELSYCSSLSRKIRAAKRILIKDTDLSELAIISSQSCDVEISMPKRRPAKIDKVHGHWIDLKNVSSNEVRSNYGPVNCLNGLFSLVQAGPFSCIRRAKVDKLELWLREGEETSICLRKSIIGDISIKVRPMPRNIAWSRRSTEHAAAEQEPSVGKIRFVGGTILGDLRCPGELEVDMSKTHFRGRISLSAPKRA
jgi:hypothetical protein